jgi:hypothetical protein
MSREQNAVRALVLDQAGRTHAVVKRRATSSSFDGAAGVDAGEVDQSSGGQHRVSFKRCGRHEDKNDPGAGTDGSNGEWDESPAMTPMEAVALAETVGFSRAQSEARIEEPVGDIDGPGRQRQKQGNPQRQADVYGPGESQRPNHGDRGGIEAG